MNPFSKSLWIVPAASGALQLLFIVQALVSSGPEVKKFEDLKFYKLY